MLGIGDEVIADVKGLEPMRVVAFQPALPVIGGHTDVLCIPLLRNRKKIMVFLPKQLRKCR